MGQCVEMLTSGDQDHLMSVFGETPSYNATNRPSPQDDETHDQELPIEMGRGAEVQDPNYWATVMRVLISLG